MKKIICFVGCFFCLLNSTWAITLNCPKIASPGEIIQCQVVEDQYIGMKANYQFDDGLRYANMQMNSNWKSYYVGMDGFSVGNVLDSNILSFSFGIQVGMDVLINQEYSIGLVNIEGTNSDYQFVPLDNIFRKIRIVSDVNTLDSLEIDTGNLNPTFSKTVSDYQAVVTGDKIVIKANPSDSSAKLEGDLWEQSLSYGGNSFVIKVISARGNAREYHLYITRKLEEIKEKSSDASLKKLSLSEAQLDFKKDKFVYFVSVPYEIDSIQVEAIPNYDKARVEIQKDDHLVVGKNTIQVKVIAEDGTSAVYLIVVDRQEKLSGDATIRSLGVKGYSLSFQSNVYQYELEIQKEDKLDLVIELNDNKAKYRILGNHNLKDNSVIQIVVTAEDGSRQIYKIHIMKLGEDTSSSIVSFVQLGPLIGFVLLIIIILIVKLLKGFERKKKAEK